MLKQEVYHRLCGRLPPDSVPFTLHKLHLAVQWGGTADFYPEGWMKGPLRVTGNGENNKGERNREK